MSSFIQNARANFNWPKCRVEVWSWCIHQTTLAKHMSIHLLSLQSIFVSIPFDPKCILYHYATNLEAKRRGTKAHEAKPSQCQKAIFPKLAKSQNHISTGWGALCLTKWIQVANKAEGGTFHTKAHITLGQQALFFVIFRAPSVSAFPNLQPNHSNTFPINRRSCSMHFLSLRAKEPLLQTHYSLFQNRVSGLKFQETSTPLKHPNTFTQHP